MKLTKAVLQATAYELYKTDWIYNHISRDVYLHTQREYYIELLENPEYDENYTFDKYLYDRGFSGGLIYACFVEFCNTEFLDADYMRSLFPENSVYWKQYIRLMQSYDIAKELETIALHMHGTNFAQDSIILKDAATEMNRITKGMKAVYDGEDADDLVRCPCCNHVLGSVDTYMDTGSAFCPDCGTKIIY